MYDGQAGGMHPTGILFGYRLSTKLQEGNVFTGVSVQGGVGISGPETLLVVGRCRAIKTKGMVFRYTWVYSKEDTMAHTRRAVVAS